MQEPTNLLVFKKSHELVLDIYNVTKTFPKDEQYALVSQMKRAASSVPTNIIEGKARGSAKEYKRFLLISRGSLEELKYHLLLAKDLGYINEIQYNALTNSTAEIGRMLAGLIKSIDAKIGES